MTCWFKDEFGNLATGRRKHTCGTSGCLLGTYLSHNTKIEENIVTYHLNEAWFHDRRAMEEGSLAGLLSHLGLTGPEFCWLFLIKRRVWNGCSTYPKRTTHKGHGIEGVKTKEAVRRLRKFIYFKLKQKEIHEAWNERHHTRGAEAKNTGFVSEFKEELLSV